MDFHMNSFRECILSQFELSQKHSGLIFGIRHFTLVFNSAFFFKIFVLIKYFVIFKAFVLTQFLLCFLAHRNMNFLGF